MWFVSPTLYISEVFHRSRRPQAASLQPQASKSSSCDVAECFLEAVVDGENASGGFESGRGLRGEGGEGKVEGGNAADACEAEVGVR